VRTVSTIADTRRLVRGARAAGKRVALVPTMGALHDGHLSLVDLARRQAQFVVMSVFVNPLQFAPTEDLAAYPRDLAGDAAKAATRGVDLLFTPDAREMYPATGRVLVEPQALTGRWEGAARPGHFGGVLTVVAKLFNIVQPDLAVFGQKDAQQVALVRAMVRDLDFPVELLVAPIVREPDGLAMSSRNAYLAFEDRERAALLSQALTDLAARYRAGESSGAALEGAARAVLAADPAVAVEYLAVVDPDTLEPLAEARAGALVLLAARLGRTRLLDNVVLPAR
jgi:pantoate--beta-alanine ligase